MVSARLLVWVSVRVTLALLGACGDSAPAAMSDGASAKGGWQLAAQTVAGSPTETATLDGALVVGDRDCALAIAAPPLALLATCSLASNGKALVLGDGTSVPVALTAEPRLTLDLAGDRRAVFKPDQAPAAGTITVEGTVTAPTTAPAYSAPRAALIFLSRTEPGFVNDERMDQALTFQGSTATFRFDLAREALGNRADRLRAFVGRDRDRLPRGVRRPGR